jgi:tellurite resistance protein TerC
MDFISADWLGTPVWFWLVFLTLVTALTAFDLGVLNKKNKEMGIGESLKLSVLYIGVALAFGLWIWAEKGGDAGLQYYTGFFIERRCPSTISS